MANSPITRAGRRRHLLVYALSRRLVPLLLHKYSFVTGPVQEPEEPCIVLCNHLTEADALMLVRAFRRQMYFVCGQHILDSSLGPVLRYAYKPISATRGAAMTGTVMEILRHLKAGYNVAMFPEGCRSFNGETLPTPVSVAKLVKAGRCALVTYRLHGGYFVAPRWAYKFRRGPVCGEAVHTYSSDEIKDMSVEDLTLAINRDLHENAYEYQSSRRLRYRGRNLAEGLENYLLICPRCGTYDSMTTSGSSFRCSCCGLSGEYDEYGLLQGDELPYHTVYDWSRWMEGRFDEDLASAGDDALLFRENDISLHTESSALRGSLLIYKDHMEFAAGEETFAFAYEDISESSLLYYGKSFLFTHIGRYFKLTGPRFHAWKLDRLVQAVRRL